MLELNEIGWPEGGAALLRGLVRIGNRAWYDARYEGYPVDRLKGDSSNTFVTAWGGNAGERRASRVELWNRQKGLILASLYPETDGRHVWFCAVNSKGRGLLGAAAADARREVGETPADFLAKIGSESAFDAGSLGAIIKAGPETVIRADRNDKSTSARRWRLPIRTRDRLPVPGQLPAPADTRSAPQRPSPGGERCTVGYRSWFADGWTQIQIQPAAGKDEKGPTFSLFPSSTRERRARAYGWRPCRRK